MRGSVAVRSGLGVILDHRLILLYCPDSEFTGGVADRRN